MASRPIMPLLGPGTMVWIPAPAKSPLVFQQAKVLAVDELSATVRTEEGSEKRVAQIDLVTTPPMICNATVEGDMTSLHHIHEPGILYNLEKRSLSSEPYTFMGSVLVTVNPLKVIPDPCIAGDLKVLAGPPHPFVVAETAFQQMTFQASREMISGGSKIAAANQSIIVAGESGAGKTEASKMILAHLVARSSKASETKDLDKRLLMTNPILESFGNAVTLRNPNSSRFGKMLRLHFDASRDVNAFSLKGATVQSYLLERSRVTAHDMGERTFHVFHQMLASLDHVDLRGLPLENKFKYRYTEPGASSPQTILSLDRDGFEKLVNALDQIGITPFFRLGVFEILAAVLIMGEIQFGDNETTEGSVAFISNQDKLAQAAQLLGVPATDLGRVFCERRITVDKSQVVSKRNSRAAGFARDAAVKAVYSNLFEWLMKRINEAVSRGSAKLLVNSTALGVLDIFGFESFQVNGFEQLLINYANESLQGTFNAQIFVAEATLYMKEGLFGTDDYNNHPSDNSLCVELLQGDTLKKQPGLLTLIDSEGKSPDASDVKLNQRIHTTFAAHPCMIRPHPKEAARTFIVRHYAGPVVYTVGTFLEKNNDRLPEDIEGVLLVSSKASVKELFETSAGASAGKKGPPARTIVMKFSSQIRTLVEDLEATKCSFVRCIKPNPSMYRDDADPSWFDRRYVTKQLHALNIPQTAEVLRNGFPTRLEYAALVDSYWEVLPEEALKRYKTGARDNKAFVRALFWAFRVGPECYKLGTTRVFFKSGQLAQLDSILKRSSEGGLDPEVVTRFRLFYARVKWRKIVVANRAAKKLMELFSVAHKRNTAAIRIQKHMRAAPKKIKMKKLKRAAVVAQRLWRGRKARELAAKMRLEKIAEARRQAEEARIKKDRDAAERAFQLEKELKEAEERKRTEMESQKKIVLEALRKQVEQRNRDERDFNRRKSSYHPNGAGGKSAAALLRRSTKVMFADGTKETSTIGGAGSGLGDAPVRVKSGGALVAQTLGQRRTLSLGGNGVLKESVDIDVEDLKAEASLRSSTRGDLKRNSSVAIVTDAARRRASRRVSEMPAGEAVPTSLAKAASAARASQKRIQGRGTREGKSALEKVATAAREEFGIKILGFALLMRPLAVEANYPSPPGTQKAGGGGLLSRLKHRFSAGKSDKPVGSNKGDAVWDRVYYVMDKPGRSLLFYTGADKVRIVRSIPLKATLKVVECKSVGAQKHVIELKDHLDGSYFVAFESQGEKRRWERDVREGVIGFRAPVKSSSSNPTGGGGRDEDDEKSYESSGDEDDDDANDDRIGELYELYSGQLRAERVTQLTLLMKNGQISQKEFDEACEIIATTPDPSGGKTTGIYLNDVEMDDAPDDDFGAQVQCPKCHWSNNTMFGRYKCVKCASDLPKPEAGVGQTSEAWLHYHDSVQASPETASANGDVLRRGDGAVLGMKPIPLTNPFTKELGFMDGRVSCELIGAQKQIDYQNFQEIILFGIDIRFRDEVEPQFEIGWVVSHRLEKFKALYNELIDANGPLIATARKKVPVFPEGITAEDSSSFKKLEDWLAALFKLVPSGSKQTKLVFVDEDDDLPDVEPPSEKPAHMLPSAWRSVRDPESGELYYFNKITGETRWENPFEEAEEGVPPKPNLRLQPNWDAVFDKESGEYYFWNKKTDETTWDPPILKRETMVKKKLLDGKDLLHVTCVNRFLDLKRNVQRMDEMAL